MDQFAGEYMGYALYFTHISWNCPALKLYGYGTERALQSAVRRALKGKP